MTRSTGSQCRGPYNEFAGMTDEEITLENLHATFKKLVKTVNSSLTDQEKDFLLSFKKNTPDWGLLGLEGIDLLPAVKWKLMNLRRMEKAKHTAAVKKLEQQLW